MWPDCSRLHLSPLNKHPLRHHLPPQWAHQEQSKEQSPRWSWSVTRNLRKVERHLQLPRYPSRPRIPNTTTTGTTE
ncbi:hypothetical protein BCR44DRAFT_1440560, partial [Catenaria anguillulae PL171]